MTLDELKASNPIYQTRTIAEVCKRSPKTHAYIVECLQRFYSGDYGEICKQDTEYNNADLLEGEGHILARYKALNDLESDIYIEAHFSQSMEGIDANNTMIMYCNER